MMLIADSGSTKTDWNYIDNEGIRHIFQTIGLNPFYHTTESIAKELSEKLSDLQSKNIQNIFFYGAGCANEEKNEIVRAGIQSIFRSASVEVNNDLLGAARATCGAQAGIACILGTGSNSCLFDGTKIIDNISPLGYILGDEGSGAVLGKKFLGNLLKRDVPDSISKLFFQKYSTDRFKILENVYKKPFPNKYLANFSIFLSENQDHTYIQNFLYKCFEEFVERNIMKYENYDMYPVHFVGSVAFHFQAILLNVLSDKKIKTGKTIKAPIEKLVEYHIENNKNI